MSSSLIMNDVCSHFASTTSVGTVSWYIVPQKHSHTNFASSFFTIALSQTPYARHLAVKSAKSMFLN